jgi:hypothetical protein
MQFDLSLENRTEDLSADDGARVFVNVLLAPAAAVWADAASGSDASNRPGVTPEPITVDGVAVMLVGPQGECLSHRLLLPIAGTLHQPMVSTVELRAIDVLPKGSRVVGLAWHGSNQWEASCPADPGTHIEAHVRGRRALQPRPRPPAQAPVFEALTASERYSLAASFPWLTPCERPPPKVVEPELETATNEEIRSFCEDLGLDEEDTDWLEALLDE